MTPSTDTLDARIATLPDKTAGPFRSLIKH